MKLRSPLSIEGAITKARDVLTATVAAEILSVSPSMIYKMGEPEHTGALRFSDAMKLDAACKAKTGETPFADLLAYHLDETRLPDTTRQLSMSFIELTSETGALASKLHDLVDTKTQEMRQPSKRDAIEIQRAVDDIVRTAENIKHDVTTA